MVSTISVVVACLVAAATAAPDLSYLPPAAGGGVGGGAGGGYGRGGPGGAGGGGGGGDGPSEPANYEFSYEVQDAAAGLDFGHKESRQGDVANGMYHVQLPDGRQQRVDYVADEQGYRPNVKYEGTATFGGPGGAFKLYF
ncbi:pro-resilin-like [Schistocerca piceifrons]|uniref:pro-resilin-like n=1 Tax=Schistocerca piceifrons TaxID=274613 RepID=UPI001F5EFC0E|nr:pro-resilin-like [Schistocerca piceifrons]